MGAFLPLASNGVFYPEDVDAMSLAYETVCHALHINGDARARETIAVRVIDLGRCGELRPSALSARVLAEAKAEVGHSISLTSLMLTESRSG